MGDLENLLRLSLSDNDLTGCVPDGLHGVETNDLDRLGLSFCDRSALTAFYRATGGSNWRNNTNWLSDRPLGEWHGVTVGTDGRVRTLGLHDNQLTRNDAFRTR